MGWLIRKAGLSADNVLSVEIVTADGGILQASPAINADLFWAVRGGGGNFGIVTEFEFRLHEVGPIVQLALSLWDLDHGPKAFRAMRDRVPSLPQDVAIFLVGLDAPPAPFVPEQFQGMPGYAMLLVDQGAPDAHREAVESLRAAVAPLLTFDTPIPYTALQPMFDESAPWGTRGYEKAVYLEELTDGAIEVIARHFPSKASPMALLPIFVLGGKYAEPAEDDTAFGGSRRTMYVLNIAALALDAEPLETDWSWVLAFWADLVPHAAGVGSYVKLHVRVRTGPDPGKLRAGEVRAPGRNQGEVRPSQSLLPQR